MYIILGFLFVIGLIIGSFLNVVILRTVSGESIVFPGSKCPKCQTQLKWFHNIPVFSYIFLKGKCAFCHEKISIQYPIIELLSGMLFTILGYLYINNISNMPEQIPLFIIMYLVSVCAIALFIVISGTDILEMQVSDVHTYSLMGLGLLYSIIIGSINFYSEYKFGFVKWNLLFSPVLWTILATVIAFLGMEILRLISNFIFKIQALGNGDSYIYAGIAAVVAPLFGAKNLIYTGLILLFIFLLSLISSVIFSFPTYVKSIIKSKNWLLLSTLTAFILYAVIHTYGLYAYWFYNTTIFIISTIVLVLIGVTLCVEIIMSIKNKTNPTETQIPYGPWLCCSGLFLLLALPIILSLG